MTEKLAEQGELLARGTGLVVVTDLANAWLNVYVSETDLGRIRLDQEAAVVTDDGQTRRGRVSFVASQAEFTPKNVQTRDERVKLVYKVKVALENKDGLFKPGHAGRGAPARGGSAAVTAQTATPPASCWSRRAGSRAASATVAAVSDVSFTVRRGEMFGLIGPDGAGKTTTLRMVLGLLKADAGTVRTCGLDPVPASGARSPARSATSRRASRSTAT